MTYPSNYSGAIPHDQLRAFFERIERLHEERKAIADDISEVYAEAKGNGFDPKIMRIVLQKRRMDRSERLEQEALVDLYMAALGMLPEADEPSRVHAHAREGKPNPVANAGEGANGAIAAASDDPASREDDGADRQQPATSGFTGEREPGSAKPVSAEQDRDPIPETPAEGAPAGAADKTHADAQSSGAATREDAVAAAPATKQWKHSDPAHPDCLDPAQCGGFSNLGLCQRCRDAATGAEAA